MTSLDAIKAMIAAVAEPLGPLLERVVFLGGAAASLLITEQQFLSVRPTDDVDIIVETASYGQYNVLLEELRRIGFVHDMNGPLCRLMVNNIKVDVMPTDEKILSFSNRWYPLAFKLADNYALRDGLMINLINAPLFLCTKFEAFADRGNGDFLASSDIEDIVAVINGRPELAHECLAMPIDVRRYLHQESRTLLSDEDFLNGLPGILPTAAANREQLFLSRLELLAANAD